MPTDIIVGYVYWPKKHEAVNESLNKYICAIAHLGTMNDNLEAFQPCQIVYLEHHNRRLFAEIIQVLPDRGRLWLRPLMLGIWSSDDDASFWDPPSELYDLREGADLVWPIAGFRLALDTEVIPLLMQLETLSKTPEHPILAHRQLRNFVNHVWQASEDA